MISLIIIITLLGVNEPVCGNFRPIPFKNPASCRNMAVGGEVYNSYFNSITMTCARCSQPVAFQRSSKDGQF